MSLSYFALLCWFTIPACLFVIFFFFFQAEDGIRDVAVTGVQTCALPICIVFCYRRPSLSHQSGTEMLRKALATIAAAAIMVTAFVVLPADAKKGKKGN